MRPLNFFVYSSVADSDYVNSNVRDVTASVVAMESAVVVAQQNLIVKLLWILMCSWKVLPMQNSSKLVMVELFMVEM